MTEKEKWAFRFFDVVSKSHKQTKQEKCFSISFFHFSMSVPIILAMLTVLAQLRLFLKFNLIHFNFFSVSISTSSVLKGSFKVLIDICSMITSSFKVTYFIFNLLLVLLH